LDDGRQLVALMIALGLAGHDVDTVVGRQHQE
jgi:hypothetical protein